MRRGVALVALLIATGCRGHATAPAADDPNRCADVAVVGAPITGRLLLDGCTSDDGTHVDVPFGPCRGTGNVTAGLEVDGRQLTGELRLAWEERPVASNTYGTWSQGLAPGPSDNFDVSGCVLAWPDETDPMPATS